MEKLYYFLFLIPSFITLPILAQPYNAAVGIRAGEPFGISFKQYLGNERAYEIVLGSAYSGSLYNDYFINRFRKNERFEDFQYVNHQVRYSLALQGRYIRNRVLPEKLRILEGLIWYYALGAQLRISNVEYTYFIPTLLSQGDEHQNLFAFGPEASIGLEYNIPKLPLSAFLELGLFLELIQAPFVPRPTSGIGLRYNFNF